MLVYAPCVFLAVFAPLDLVWARTSMYSNIPWSWNNILRLLVTALLIVSAVADIVVAATWPMPEAESARQFFDVHWVTPAVKIVTFVSILTGLNRGKIVSVAILTN